MYECKRDKYYYNISILKRTLNFYNFNRLFLSHNKYISLDINKFIITIKLSHKAI